MIPLKLTKEQFRERLLSDIKKRQTAKKRLLDNLLNGYQIDAVAKSKKIGRRGSK